MLLLFMKDQSKASNTTGSSSWGPVWMYLKYQFIFLVVSAGLVGLIVLVSMLLVPGTSVQTLDESSDAMIDVFAFLIFFMILFGSDLKLPLIIGFTALSLVPVSFFYLPDILQGKVQPLVVMAFVFIELIALIVTFQIKIWISEEEDIQPPA